MQLRNYQRAAVDGIFSEWKESRSTLAVLPTGTGKTVIFAFVIKRAFPSRAMVVVHREELATQAKDKIERVTGFRAAIEMGERRVDMGQGSMFSGLPQVVVASVQTLTAGGDGFGRMGKFDPNQFGLVIVDEAHHATAHTYQRVVKYFGQNERCRILGVTATPDRADEEALGQVFETVAMDYEILDAIGDGWLVPIEQQMVTVGDLDFSHIRTTAGDLNGGDLAAIMEEEKALHGIATPSMEIIGDRRALVFAASVKHAERLAEIFNRHRNGSAAFVCGETDKDERRDILRQFSAGDLQIVCNCGVLTEGFDDPGVEVIVMGRPTKSRALYAQMVGRATRPLAGLVDGHEADSPEQRRALIAASRKPTCLVVDFEGNAGRHKLMTSADILGGKVSDRALAIAKDRARKEKVNMAEALDAAEAQVRAEDEARVRAAAARRAKLIGKASYTSTSVSPFDVLGVRPWAPRAWNDGKTLSPKQQALLSKQGIDPASLDYAQGKQLISEICRRWDEGLCSFKQARVLARNGLPTDVTRDEASKLIDGIARTKWRKGYAHA